MRQIRAEDLICHIGEAANLYIGGLPTNTLNEVGGKHVLETLLGEPYKQGVLVKLGGAESRSGIGIAYRPNPHSKEYACIDEKSVALVLQIQENSKDLLLIYGHTNGNGVVDTVFPEVAGEIEEQLSNVGR